MVEGDYKKGKSLLCIVIQFVLSVVTLSNLEDMIIHIWKKYDRTGKLFFYSTQVLERAVPAYLSELPANQGLLKTFMHKHSDSNRLFNLYPGYPHSGQYGIKLFGNVC